MNPTGKSGRQMHEANSLWMRIPNSSSEHGMNGDLYADVAEGIDNAPNAFRQSRMGGLETACRFTQSID